MTDQPFAKRLDAHLAGFRSLGFSPAAGATLDQLVDDARVATPGRLSVGYQVEFSTEARLSDLFGMFGPARTDHALTLHASTTRPDLPLPPRKGRQLQGKRYRIARRGYGRAVRAWRKAGRPTVTKPQTIHVPRASIAPDGPGRYTVTPLPARGPSPTVAWVDEVLEWKDGQP